MKEIRALTSLRGVAAIWVFLFHLDSERPLFPHQLRDWLPVGRGYIAVDLFFVLSGFVLALTYRESFLARPPAHPCGHPQGQVWIGRTSRTGRRGTGGRRPFASNRCQNRLKTERQ